MAHHSGSQMHTMTHHGGSQMHTVTLLPRQEWCGICFSQECCRCGCMRVSPHTCMTCAIVQRQLSYFTIARQNRNHVQTWRTHKQMQILVKSSKITSKALTSMNWSQTKTPCNEILSSLWRKIKWSSNNLSKSLLITLSKRSKSTLCFSKKYYSHPLSIKKRAWMINCNLSIPQKPFFHLKI